MNHPSKISRLPRDLREELNRRLDKGQSGKEILAWINALPEVQAFLAAEYDGQPINKINLCNYRTTGFRQWQMRQAALEFALNDAADLAIPNALPDSLTHKLSQWIALRYAAAAQTMAPTDEDPESELRSLRDLCAAVVALRRGELEASRLDLEQKRLALIQSETQDAKEKEFWEWTKRADIQTKLYPHRDKEKMRKEVERMLNFKLLGIPYPTNEPDETSDPAMLI
ncbi:MAG TPA: hypothetical protein VNT26_13725 [Candidatus Sulfotelmatobacter sp.]|nr:hypothetical protein [Candidatus Sulfotelmatobacter sp.]